MFVSAGNFGGGMNRKTRREIEQQLMSRSNMSREEAKFYVSAMDAKPKIKDGTPVKLNFAKITTDPEYKERLSDYKQFVWQNQDAIFHAKEYRGAIFALEENDRWLFWEGDLIPMEAQDGQE